MSEMVERVATAISGVLYGDDEKWRLAARAAIEAMRDPTDRICAMSLCSDFAENIWPRMIDEALK